MWRKSKENLEKRRFPVFSARKKMFSKIGLSHILGIANTRFCAKNQEKKMMKSRENPKKTGFSGIFPAFSAEKKIFRKSVSLIF